MLAGVSIARAARQLGAAAARKQFSAYRPQWHAASFTRARPFSVAAALCEKKYTQDHEWVELSEDGKTCTLGISTYAANALGDVVYIELPELDLEVSAGDAIGSVESVKSASDILTPVAGTVKEVNSTLEEKPGNINKDPEGEAWIAKVELQGELDSESVDLMTAEEYKKFTEE